MKRIASLGLGKLAILAALASVLFVLVAFGQNMFSAGPLSEQNRKQLVRGGVSSHAEITSCSACHAPAWSSDTMATRCLNCHENIRAQLGGAKPMHGLLAQGQACLNCHTEHKGPHADLTSFAHFDHECTAFKLAGMHQKADCGKCHTDKLYQGTPQSCVSCHAEPAIHKDKFGVDCMQCHTPNTWQATAFTAAGGNTGKFNHDTTGFPLRDKHAALDCKSCHVKESFKGLAQSCVSCHKEPEVHRGKFGLNCKQCHGTNNWKSATLSPESLTSIKFDHDTTGFKLTGKHRTTDCKSCHTTSTFKGTPQSCVACHAEPPSHKPHPKSFGADCTQCHSTLAWKGATLVKHTFPMNHRSRNRQNSACAVCHPAKINTVALTGLSTSSPSYASYTCYGCHHTSEREAQRHARRKVANLNNCAFCHPTGRGNKGRAAVDCPFDLELCRSCPEAAESRQQTSDFLTGSCPSAGVSNECPLFCKDDATRLLSLGQDSEGIHQVQWPSQWKNPVHNDMPLKTRGGSIVDFVELEATSNPGLRPNFAVPERSTRTNQLWLRIFDMPIAP